MQARHWWSIAFGLTLAPAHGLRGSVAGGLDSGLLPIPGPGRTMPPRSRLARASQPSSQKWGCCWAGQRSWRQGEVRPRRWQRPVLFGLRFSPTLALTLLPSFSSTD